MTYFVGCVRQMETTRTGCVPSYSTIKNEVNEIFERVSSSLCFRNYRPQRTLYFQGENMVEVSTFCSQAFDILMSHFFVCV